MFGNLINGQDLRWAATRLPTRFGSFAKRVLSTGKQRTRDLYTLEPQSDQWWNVPSMQARWNRLVSGDAAVDHYGWIAKEYLTRSGLTALSLGSGMGTRELRWARTGRFRHILGIDLTPAPVEAARRAAAEAGLDGIVQFEVGDLSNPALWGDRRYDVLIGEHSIHHLSPLRRILEGLRDRLAPDGLFLVDEFVGPIRFQWTDAQLRCCNALLSLLPERLRRMQDGTIKRREHRPSVMFMRIKDPSEAIESERILPLLDELYERVVLRPYGGTVLHILLSGIAHNFASDDEEAARFLRLCTDAEDTLLASGELPSDFVVAVYRKRR